MDIAEVKESINAAIDSERSQVIGLVGDWGIGKTHVWKAYAFDNREKLAARYEKYAYVSLFGLASPKDIKATLLEKLISTKLISHDAAKTMEEAAKEQIKRRTAITTGVLKKLRELVKRSDSGWGSVGSGAIDMTIAALEFRAAQKALICFDDLERISPTLDAAEVMGVIDNLARERACKVVVIFSPENMDAQGPVLKRYREKLFDREVRLNPPISYSVEIGCNGLEKTAKTVISQCATRLELKNIRIVRRIADSLLDIRAHVPRMREEIEGHIVTSLVLLTYCHLTSKAGVPSLDEVKEIPFLGMGERNEAPNAQIEFLKSYGWIGFDDEADPIIADYVTNGTCDWNALSKFVEAGNRDQSKHARVEKLRNVWREYRDRFMNAVELSTYCGRVAQLYVKEIEVVDTQFLDGALDLLRGVNEPHLAQTVFAAWKEAHSQDRAMLGLGMVETYQKIVNRDIREYCEHQLAQLPAPPPKDVREILIRMANDRSWGGDDTEFLVGASVEDYVSALRKGMLDIGPAVKHLLNSKPDELNYGLIAQSLRDALRILAQESHANWLKVKAMGIELS